MADPLKSDNQATPSRAPLSSATEKARAAITPVEEKDTRGRKTNEERDRVKALDALLGPESMMELVTVPFDLLEITTGFEGWELEPGEKALLAKSASGVAKEWLTIDPKYISLIIFGLSLAKIATIKGAAYHAYKKEQNAKPKAEKT